MRYEMYKSPEGYKITVFDNSYNLNGGMWNIVGSGRTQSVALKDFKEKYFKKMKELEDFGEKLKSITDFKKDFEKDEFFYYVPNTL